MVGLFLQSKQISCGQNGKHYTWFSQPAKPSTACWLRFWYLGTPSKARVGVVLINNSICQLYNVDNKVAQRSSSVDGCMSAISFVWPPYTWKIQGN